MTRTFTLILGVVLLLVGLLGYALTPDGGLLLGLFAVNGPHNLIHVLTGVLAIAAWWGGWSRLFCQVFGIVYLMVAVLGFLTVDDTGMLMGMVHVNMADNILHLLIAAPSLYFGFASPRVRAPAV
jgi:hypothetical protein